MRELKYGESVGGKRRVVDNPSRSSKMKVQDGSFSEYYTSESQRGGTSRYLKVVLRKL